MTRPVVDELSVRIWSILAAAAVGGFVAAIVIGMWP